MYWSTKLCKRNIPRIYNLGVPINLKQQLKPELDLLEANGILHYAISEKTRSDRVDFCNLVNSSGCEGCRYIHFCSLISDEPKTLEKVLRSTYPEYFV